MELLRLNAASKSSPISEGVTEIQIVYTLQGMKPDTMTLKSHEDTISSHSSQRNQRVKLGPTSP
jgi:hypothetical protein